MAGLTAEGLEIRTQPEIQEILEEKLAIALPGANVRAGPLHQLVGILSEELALAWESLQAVYSGFSSDASGVLLDQIAELTGTTRRAATRSRVVASVNLNAGVTLAAGAIAAVDGDPDAQFRTIADATNGGGTPADVDVELESIATGPVAAPAGTLILIVTPASGWNSITNVADTELGLDIAGDADLRVQRRVELAGPGSRSLGAIRAQVAKVDDVLEVQVQENTSLVTDGDGRPGKSLEVIVWDGDPAGADDDEIAQAILDSKPDGILAHGVVESGTAIDDTGNEVVVAFSRATALRVYVNATVVLEAGVAAGWEAQAQAAVAARGDEYVVGETAYASQLLCALLEVPGIVAVTLLTLEPDDPSPDNALVDPAYDEIVRISTGDVTVAE
jgi:uncharacterized phage protein gp47/JayE